MLKRRVYTSILCTLIAVPIAGLAILALPMTQRFFLPPPDTIAALIEESKQAPQPVGAVLRDVVYDSDLFQDYTLDIYAPLDIDGGGSAETVLASARPAVVFFHGGSWLRGDKITILIVDRFLARMRREGWFVVSVNYTTSVLRGIGGAVAQARSALQWVRDHAETYGWDPYRIGLYGVSAGGHVALLATHHTSGSTPDTAFVFAECAPTDLIAMREGDAYQNSGSFRIFPESRLAELSPIRRVRPGMPPVLLFHGDADRTVDVGQSIRYAEAIRDAGGSVTLVVWPGGDHAFLNLSDSEWYRQETIALDWMRSAFAESASR